MNLMEYLLKIKNYLGTTPENPIENSEAPKFSEVPSETSKFFFDSENAELLKGRYRLRPLGHGVKVYQNVPRGRYLGFIRNSLWLRFCPDDDSTPTDSQVEQMLSMGIQDGRGRKRK